MPQDAFTIKYVAKELKQRLVGGKISRIIQPSRDSLTFIIYTGKSNVKLEACLSAQSARLSITEDETVVPVVAPNFCMLLRKHLQNAEILDIVQPDFERIIYFDFKCTSEFTVTNMRLYFEIMGKYSNAVLCENGVIVGALKTTSISESTKRILFGGVKYAPPEPQDKLSYEDTEKINNILKNFSGDKTKFICENIKGISYATALEIVNTYGENLTAENIRDYICSDPASPCVTYINGEPADFKVRSTAKDKKPYPDVLSAQSAYYSYTSAKKNFNEKKVKLLSALNSGVKKLDKRLAQMREKLDECRDMEEIKLKGELITANIFAIGRGAERFEAVNYYDENCGKITVELDKTLSPSQNAQKYYKKYAKLKRTKQNVDAQLAAAQVQNDYLNCINAHICTAETLADLEETEEELASLQLLKSVENKKKKPAAPPYRTYFSEGFKILAGRNNIQNERLTKSLAPDDLWLHTQKYHSSHVAVISEGRKIPDSVIKVAAEICAYYSDGREGSKIPVDYTLKKYVKKPPASNTGFVIYTDYSTALAEPDKHIELTEKTDG
ncbi:MAG: NFACT family protein [Clostridia bacterium]|nr:NFACT family protein [Clostridia bacterium]